MRASDPSDRLRSLRREAGFEASAAAARAFGWNPNTYRSHENGVRRLTLEAAIRYAGAYGADSEWLLLGRPARGSAPRDDELEVLRLYRDLPGPARDAVRAAMSAFLESAARVGGTRRRPASGPRGARGRRDPR